jgi:hypothetical protein
MPDVLVGTLESDGNGASSIVVGQHRFTVPKSDIEKSPHEDRAYVISKDAVPTPVPEPEPVPRPFKAYVYREVLDRLEHIKKHR